ncbi:MAG: glycosyltransferase family 9 protein [Chlorobi bacterium]|nr:glycosyltransferase family 9 protein [Chlorobiota bacterium]
MGDVIRTTSLLQRFKIEFPTARIFWLTKFKDILPNEIDWPLEYTLENLTWIKSIPFEMGINLDKDPEACALMDQLTINNKFGFGLSGGMPAPLNSLAEHKFLTGISDDLSKKNRKHYLEEIFEICGLEYRGEEYLLPEPCYNKRIEEFVSPRKVVGLNTGCGGRWVTRLWPENYWEELAVRLMDSGYTVLLLGGPEEHEKNCRIAKKTSANYLGVFPILEFLGLIQKCDLVVTAVTMAMHLAIGLKIPLILFNNIFNPNEFHFFTKSTILTPAKQCECYYRPKCIHEKSCMYDLSVDSVFKEIQRLVPV